MVFLSGIAGGVYMAGRHLATPSSEIDGAGLVASSFFGVRANTATQTFEKRFTSIDYKVKRQKLHREDIRDLTELTTARMEIYQLVGTLLLAFCMGWYTDSSVWDLPVWFTDLWLISNFAAVGYLLICVWLSMYAAVAARSVGTRLLTSYARLSIPTQAEIDDIKNPIFFNTKDAIKRKLREKGLSRSSSDPDLRGPSAAKKTAAPGEPAADAAAVTEEACEDHEQHFRVFLQELPRWLVYDTWARVCMSYGMNQMLQTLSYFSLGSLWKKSPMVAITSYFSVNVLATVILWLDVGDRDHTTGDYVAVFFLNFVPPMLATILLLYESIYSYLDAGGRAVAALLVVACFCAHGGWLYYMECLCATAGSKQSRFRPGMFANVLEWIKPAQPVVDEDPDPPSPMDVMAPFQPAASQGDACGVDRCKSVKNLCYRPTIDVAEESEERAHLIGYGNHNFSGVNGGGKPGQWMRPKHNEDIIDADSLHSFSWLPVRMIAFFTYFIIGWGILQGFVHGCMIGFDSHNTMESFTGSDDMSPLLQDAMEEHIAWPAPARLFKVASLFCGSSELLVSNEFSMYAIGQNESTGAVSSGLSLVKDGVMSAVICGARGCDALSPPGADGHWTLVPLASGSGAPTKVPIPKSWRVVTGAWRDCPQEAGQPCTLAWLAGWDGDGVFAALLTLDAEAHAWDVHIRFEVDPAIGRPGTDSGLDCSRPAKREPYGRPWTVRMPSGVECAHIVRYGRVSSLQMSNAGKNLIVLDRGIADVWDMARGVVVKRLNVGEGYNSICQSGRHIFLSRESDAGPVVSSLEMPPALSALLGMSKPKVTPAANQDAAVAAPARGGPQRSLRNKATSMLAAAEAAVSPW